MQTSPQTRPITGAINAILGLWLFMSAFFWPHTPGELVNASMVGMLVVTFAISSAQGQRWARFALLALGGWLLVSTFLYRPYLLLTQRNHELVGGALVVLGLIPNRLRAAVLTTQLFRHQVVPR